MSFDIQALLSPAAARTARPYVDFPEFEIRWAFEAGLPDPATFPVEDLARICGHVLRIDAAEGLQYGTPRQSGLLYGYAGLRRELLARTAAAPGRELGLADVMLTSGGVQAITLALRAFLTPGDVLAVEAPTWNAVLDAAEHLGAETVAVPMDEEGMVVDALEDEMTRLARAGKHLKLVYTIDTFNTPTGLCLSERRRRRLLDLAADNQFVVVEDHVYGDLRYDGPPIPTLFEMDTAGLVVKIDSFSKTVAPALRLGWVTAPPAAISAMAGVRGDLGVSQWLARVMAEFLRQGLLEPHLAMVNDLYRIKRDRTDTALHRHCSDLVSWRKPDGGFFFWLEMDPEVNSSAVFRKALAEGVVCRPGERFFGQPGSGRGFLRVAFTMVPIEQIEPGIEILGRALRESLSDGASA